MNTPSIQKSLYGLFSSTCNLHPSIDSIRSQPKQYRIYKETSYLNMQGCAFASIVYTHIGASS